MGTWDGRKDSYFADESDVDVGPTEADRVDDQYYDDDDVIEETEEQSK